MKKLFTIAVALFTASTVFACTAVVVAGRNTSSGRSMMIKVRDSDERDSDYFIFKGPKYKFIGNTAKARSNRSSIKGTVAGHNEAGLCMASLTPGKGFDYDSLYNKRVSGGKLIYKALGKCRNLQEFEAMCNEILKERIIIAHIVAIDAEGGAATYEFGGRRFRKFDANDPKDAPKGWRAMTNFSFTGDPSLGSGQVRYDNACKIMAAMPRNADGKYEFTPMEFADAICRSCVQTDLNIKNEEDLLKKTMKKGKQATWFSADDFITRYRTALTTTFEAAAPGENPSHTIIWAQMGSPFTTPLIPISLASGHIPQYISRLENEDGEYEAKGEMVTLSDIISGTNIYNMPGDSKKRYFNTSAALKMIELSRKVDSAVAEMYLSIQERWRSGNMSDGEFFAELKKQQSQYFEIYKKVFGDYVK